MSIRDSDNFTHVPNYIETAEKYVSFRNNTSSQQKVEEENVKCFVRVRPPFKQEVDDIVFDPGLNGEQMSDQWQCTFTDQYDNRFIELEVPKERKRTYFFDSVFDDQITNE